MKIIRFWGPPILWALLIFVLSSRPTGVASEIDWKDFFVKKTAHVIFYGILTTFTYRALTNGKMDKTKAGYFSIFTAFIYGITDEVHQSFTPGRDPTLRDVIFDTIGAILAIYTLWKLLPKAPEKLKALASDLQLL